MVSTPKPNGFADHYPYEMAISLGIYPIFRHTHVMLALLICLGLTQDRPAVKTKDLLSFHGMLLDLSFKTGGLHGRSIRTRVESFKVGAMFS